MEKTTILGKKIQHLLRADDYLNFISGIPSRNALAKQKRFLHKSRNEVHASSCLHAWWKTWKGSRKLSLLI